MDCLVQPQNSFWTGVLPQGLPSFHQRNYFPNFYIPRKRSFSSSFYPGPSLFFPHDDDVDYPTDIKGELSTSTMPYPTMADESGEVKLCVVCGERASGFYFGALVCLPCKSFYIRCTKEGEPAFTCQCSGNCDIVKQGRIRCQYCRYQRCLMAGMCRKEKPETVQPAEGQVLCKVCGDIANGIHFGVNTCEGCKKFFRRGLVENQSYICKSDKDCGINPRNRNNCRYCRYQKCIEVGMSREAIKMGRPKKAEGTENPSNPADSPKVARRPIVDVDNHQDMTKPSNGPRLMRDESSDTLNSPSVRDAIKQETERSSCEYEKKVSDVWRQASPGSMGPWDADSQAGLTSRANNVEPSNTQTNNVAATEFIEEEMDEILMLLQNDNQSSGQQQSKKMRSYGYGDMTTQKECKTEYCESGQAQWHVPETIQPSMPQGMSMPAGEPMNMSTNPMSQIPTRPPPQYPGYNRNFQQDQLPGQTIMPPSPPCQSPNRQMPSPGGYMSDSSVQSPGYIPNGGSPVHSPCQYSPSNSPTYQSCGSPHSCHYQYDSSPQGSPYSDSMYQHSPYSQQRQYLDLSVNVNCGQSTVNPVSPGQHSPMYKTMKGQTNTSLSMTIPPQEGGVNSQDIWCMAGSPSHYCHSPSHNPQTIPNQERGFKRGSASWHENLKRINNFFTTPSACERHDLHLIAEDEIEGSMTRSDIEREVVYKTLASLSPAESYFYVLSDACSSDSNCSTNYDEFTSCRRVNKRKACDDTDICDSTLSSGFQIGKYKRQLTETYWRTCANMDEVIAMTTEKQMLLEHLCRSFQQMTDRCTDSTKQASAQNNRNWQQIQLRIVKNTSAMVKFASQIPGFSSVHPEDKSFLCKNVSFMGMLLMAGHQLYNPAEKNFRDFWNWNINQQNPFFGFKQRLIEVGERIHNSNMDLYEVATLSALLFIATDFVDLAGPEALEETRRSLLSALRSYELSKGVDVKSRLSELFALVPEIRHVGMWHHELMKHMKISIQPQEVHQLVDTVGYRGS